MQSVSDIVARLNRNSSDSSRPGCTLCGYPGHFRYQCRNFQQLNPNREVALDVSSTSSDSEIDMMTIALPNLQIASGSNSINNDEMVEGQSNHGSRKEKEHHKKKKKHHKSKKHGCSSSSSDSDSGDDHHHRRHHKRHHHHRHHKDSKGVHKKYVKSRSRSRSRGHENRHRHHHKHKHNKHRHSHSKDKGSRRDCE